MASLLDSFVFGAVNSVHCAAMCGPLALACGGGHGAAAAYHLARLSSYTLLGLGIGAFGRSLGADALGPTAPIATLVLGIAVLLFAVTGDRLAVKLPLVGPLLARLTRWCGRQPPALRGATLGALTPLLPCGLLWAAVAAAALAGSGAGGAVVMGGLALGSLPLLWLVQGPVGRAVRGWSTGTADLVRRLAMGLAAGALLWRGVAGLQGGCCH